MLETALAQVNCLLHVCMLASHLCWASHSLAQLTHQAVCHQWCEPGGLYAVQVPRKNPQAARASGGWRPSFQLCAGDQQLRHTGGQIQLDLGRHIMVTKGVARTCLLDGCGQAAVVLASTIMQAHHGYVDDEVLTELAPEPGQLTSSTRSASFPGWERVTLLTTTSTPTLCAILYSNTDDLHLLPLFTSKVQTPPPSGGTAPATTAVSPGYQHVMDDVETTACCFCKFI